MNQQNNNSNYQYNQQNGNSNYRNNQQNGNPNQSQKNGNSNYQNNRQNTNNQSQKNTDTKSQNESKDNQLNYENAEIFSLANKSCLIGFNNLMKNTFLEKDLDARKLLTKKNKIQISYVDLSKKTNNKHPKYDFFIDPDEMKGFIDQVYTAILSPGTKNNVRLYGHKFLGGTKEPCVSNIIDFKFMTEKEYNDSPANIKIKEKFEQNANGTLDWKNLQVAKFTFDKQHGRIMNGLIVPTGKKLEGCGFKTYFLSTQNLLELCVTMRDAINRTEFLFSMEDKFQKIQVSLEDKMKTMFSDLLTKVTSIMQPNNKLATNDSITTEAISEKLEVKPSDIVSDTLNVNSNETPNSNPPVISADQKTMNEVKFLIEKANPYFLQISKDKQMNIFLNCLQTTNKCSYIKETNTINIEFKFNSSMYEIDDYSNCHSFFNQNFEFALKKVAKDEGKRYLVSMTQL